MFPTGAAMEISTANMIWKTSTGTDLMVEPAGIMEVMEFFNSARMLIRIHYLILTLVMKQLINMTMIYLLIKLPLPTIDFIAAAFD